MLINYLDFIHQNFTSTLREIILDIGIILGVPMALIKHISSEYKKVIEGQYELNRADTKAGVNGSAYSSAYIHNRMIIEDKYKPPFYLFFLTYFAKRKVKNRNIQAINTIKKIDKR